jgi:hypothetical protein
MLSPGRGNWPQPAVDEGEHHAAAPVAAVPTGVGTLFKEVPGWTLVWRSE